MKLKSISYNKGYMIKLNIKAPRNTVIVKNISAANEPQFEMFAKDFISSHNIDVKLNFNRV